MLLTLFLTLMLQTVTAQDSVYEPVVKKQSQKVQRRWTLEDWFVIKRKRRAQDLWLSMNRRRGPIFELITDVHGGSSKWKRDGSDPQDEDFRIAGGGVQIHIGPVGFGMGRDQYKIVDKEQYWEQDAGTVYLRLLGSSTQTTQLTVLGGKAKSEHDFYGNFDQTFYGALSSLYIFRHFGIEGLYRVMNTGESETHKGQSTIYHWGLFWELSLLRVYVNYQQAFNRAKNLSTAVEEDERVHGTVFGARLYF